MANKVVLDALIPREDFDVRDENVVSPVGRSKTTLSIPDLEYESFFFSAIRKPDFQRETNEWDSEKICQFIKSYIEGELIPAIILWRSVGSYIFVIDGSHRLSALACWINDDYGDGEISRKYYEGFIPEEQLKIAQETRELVNEVIGPFKQYKLASREPQKVRKYIAEKAKNLGALALQVQWVEGNSKKAEESFFKINQQAAPINKTELQLIKSRNKPNGMAARAIMRSGKGHKYWSNFSLENQTSVQQIAEEVHNLIFKPNFSMPIKTLDLPIGGKLFSSQGLSLVFETINICNEYLVKEKSIDKISDDLSGETTIKYLTNCRKVLRRINSMDPSSLGLHPIPYFYSLRGRHKVASYYAVLSFVMYLEKNKCFDKFIKIREKFESTLIQYEFLVQQIVRKYRQSNNGFEHIKDFYVAIMDNLTIGHSINETISNVANSDDFSYLSPAIKSEEVKSKEFSRDTKSLAFIQESIKNINKCAICKGFLHKNSITIDHRVRKEDGGLGNIENAQLAHPYCNSTYKN
ncbi:HNH endonuclease family protein [Laceyella tengchongensis]